MFFDLALIEMVKKVFISLIAVVLAGLLLSACYGKTAEYKLSKMKDGELIQHITSSNVTIPENVSIDTIREIIIQLEENPEYPAPVLGYTVMEDFFEDIRIIVKEYYAFGSQAVSFN